jgi:transposase-like protein
METYSQEFKDQIVELHRKGGRTFMDLAKEFNLSATTVSNWVRAAEKREAKAARAKAAGGESGESDQAKDDEAAQPTCPHRLDDNRQFSPESHNARRRAEVVTPHATALLGDVANVRSRDSWLTRSLRCHVLSA